MEKHVALIGAKLSCILSLRTNSLVRIKQRFSNAEKTSDNVAKRVTQIRRCRAALKIESMRHTLAQWRVKDTHLTFCQGDRLSKCQPRDHAMPLPVASCRGKRSPGSNRVHFRSGSPSSTGEIGRNRSSLRTQRRVLEIIVLPRNSFSRNWLKYVYIRK